MTEITTECKVVCHVYSLSFALGTSLWKTFISSIDANNHCRTAMLALKTHLTPHTQTMEWQSYTTMPPDMVWIYPKNVIRPKEYNANSCHHIKIILNLQCSNKWWHETFLLYNGMVIFRNHVVFKWRILFRRIWKIVEYLDMNPNCDVPYLNALKWKVLCWNGIF